MFLGMNAAEITLSEERRYENYGEAHYYVAWMGNSPIDWPGQLWSCL